MDGRAAMCYDCKDANLASQFPSTLTVTGTAVANQMGTMSNEVLAELKKMHFPAVKAGRLAPLPGAIMNKTDRMKISVSKYRKLKRKDQPKQPKAGHYHALSHLLCSFAFPDRQASKGFCPRCSCEKCVAKKAKADNAQ